MTRTDPSTLDGASASENPPDLSSLIREVMRRRGYSSVTALSNHTTIPYKTLWAWERGTRNKVRPPTPDVLRKFAEDFGMPEAVVFRAAGRRYDEPGSLDDETLDLVETFRSLDTDDRARLLRIVDIFRRMDATQRISAEGVLGGLLGASGR